MAVEKVGETLPGVEAAADLSTHQFKFVKMTSTGINICGAGEAAVGVLQNKPSALGQAATVWGAGTVSKVVAGAAVAKGAKVTPDATGRAVTAASGNYEAGQALDASTGAGQLISVWYNPQGRAA